MKTPLPERIHQIINGTNGTKASFLAATLATEYLNYNGNEIRAAIITMIRMHELIEVEYVLPSGKNESLLLPKGTEVMR